MSEKHTPGPWRIDRESDDYEINIVGKPVWPATRFGVKGEWDVCKVEPDSRDTDANARLIAAAPDMLAALVLAEEALSAKPSEKLGTKLNALIAVRRAITKTTPCTPTPETAA